MKVKLPKHTRVAFTDDAGIRREGALVGVTAYFTHEDVTLMAVIRDDENERLEAPLDTLAWIDALPLDAVSEDANGRHRPDGFQAPKQDAATRAKARRALTHGARRMVECSTCHELFKPRDLAAHPCDGAVHEKAASGGSITFAVADRNRFPDKHREDPWT